MADLNRLHEKRDAKREKVVSCKGVNIRYGMKEICGKKGTNHTFHAVETKNHGVIFMCDECYNKGRQQYTYSIENDLKVNGAKKHGFTYSFEMELSKHEDSFVRMLQYNNFMPTYDSTVAIEYKSPIYQSLNGIRKLFRSMSKELSNDYFDYNVGTHCNIGHTSINLQTIRYLSRFYHSLFLPMSRWLELNPLATEKLYGRQIGGWASPINENTDPFRHENFINLQHTTHVEFRLCKFIDEKQYVDVVQLNTKMMKALINNFIEHFNREDFDTTRYASIRDYRRHKARLTGQKLVSLIEKECIKKNIPFTSLEERE